MLHLSQFERTELLQEGKHRSSQLLVCVCFQYELATGRFPYPKWNSVFDQLTQVVKGEPPQLSNSEERQFSPKFINFVNLWYAPIHPALHTALYTALHTVSIWSV